jgi:hypothetical protein
MSKKIGVGLLGTCVLVIGVVVLLSISPFASSTTATPYLSLKYREVQDGSDICDNYNSYPCTYCDYYNGSAVMYHLKDGFLSKPYIDAICTDLLTAHNAKIAWHARYYAYNDSYGNIAGVNINATSGVLYPGQSIEFFFGLWGGYYEYNPDVVSITGVDVATGKVTNTVEIGYAGEG